MADARRLPPEQFAALYAQFARGLPARVAAMRQALDALGAGPSVEAATALYLTAHALRGTAMTYGALDLVPRAEQLERWGEVWRHDGRVEPAQLADARRELELLDAATDAAVRAGPPLRPD